jgi:hypothetical protein
MTETAGLIALEIATIADPATPNYIVAPLANYWAEGVYELQANFPIGTNALEALQLVVESEPFGFMYEDFTTQGIRSNDQLTRSSAEPDYILSGDEILDNWEVSKTVVNQVTRSVVEYVGGTQEFVIPSDFGQIELQSTTIIKNAPQALEYAEFQAGRRSELRFSIPSITIPLGILPDSRIYELLAHSSNTGLSINSLVEIPEIRPYIETKYFIEGWVESISRSSWNLTLAMSDIALSRWYQRWNQAELAWEDVPAGRTWLDLEYEWI